MPKATPVAIVQKLHDATVAVMNVPAVEERLRETGNDPVAPDRRSPEYLKTLVEREIRNGRLLSRRLASRRTDLRHCPNLAGNVAFGSKAEQLKLSICCPKCPPIADISEPRLKSSMDT